ncbi:hypothetical protein EOD39_12051 [Acipenser ruthenus]|uniref:Uncharacterized protein n=1 Tax=Acipenser ruthenus TaxID=7906 RepID=A0A444UMB0_ACIRT|nr:hypothetical protein EOD39_12051 [Acipenser ruthenus]
MVQLNLAQEEWGDFNALNAALQRSNIAASSSKPTFPCRSGVCPPQSLHLQRQRELPHRPGNGPGGPTMCAVDLPDTRIHWAAH